MTHHFKTARLWEVVEWESPLQAAFVFTSVGHNILYLEADESNQYSRSCLRIFPFESVLHVEGLVKLLISKVNLALDGS